MPKAIAIIPARFASSRFPGKPLASIKGKSMVQRVYEQAVAAKGIHGVVVATDDNRILEHVKTFGGKAVLTSANHKSGTERCAEAYELLNETFDYVVNIQGDEPFIAPELIEQVIMGFTEQAAVVTAVKAISDHQMLFDSNVVKAVLSENQHALYFSRQTIPFLRDVPMEHWLGTTPFYKHIGIYAFRAEVLKKLVQLPESTVEVAEKLEQLRWLSNGYSIRAVITEHESIGIDTPEDLLKVGNF